MSTPVPITAYPGRELHPDFSPDGNQITFTWNGPERDNYDIYVKRIGDEQAERLTDHPGDDFNSVWSPDGRRIAFVRRIEGESGAVMLVPAVGGAARQVVSIPSGFRRTISQSRYLTWHPDGRHLVVAMPEAEDGPFELHAVDVETGDARKLFATESLAGDTDPAISPDGSKLAFTRRVVAFTSEIDVVELSPSLVATGHPKKVVQENIASLPAWTPGGRELIFRTAFAQGAGLYRTTLDGEAELILPQASSPAVSANGGLVMTFSNRDYDTWEVDITTQDTRPIASSTFVDVTPQYSPDGAKVVFSSSRSGFREIWICDRDGSNPTRLTNLESRMASGPYWSPDSSWITFQAYFEDHGDIYVVRVSGGEPVNLTNHPADDKQPTVSRDGRWIYFGSDRSGEYRIWKVGPDGGVPVPVTAGEQEQYALESVDGRTLYYSDGARLWSMPAAGGAPVLELEPFPLSMNWAVWESGVYFQKAATTPNVIEHYDFRSKTVTPVMENDTSSYYGLSLSPDERSILYTQGEPGESDIMLVEDFR